MSTMIIDDLRTTIIGRWLERLAGNKSAHRNHWQTKIVYFRSVAGLLAARPGPAPTWRNVVIAAQPLGRKSTFYDVAGTHARHRMLDDLLADGRPDAMQIALSYLRNDAVEQLIDETKVWSYWPYRQHLLARVLRADMTGSQMEQALTQSLIVWARRNDNLAAALDYSPPACAVEDLTLLRQGQLAAMRAASQLSDVLRAEAANPLAEVRVHAMATVPETRRIEG